MQSGHDKAAEAIQLYVEAIAQRARDIAAAKGKGVNSVPVEVDLQEVREERVETEAKVVY